VGRFGGTPRSSTGGTNVLVPQFWAGGDELRHQGGAALVVEHRDVHTVLGEPIVPTDKRSCLTDHHRADTKLADQPTAVPTRRQRGHHDRVAVVELAAGGPERGGFSMDGGVVILHPAVVTAPEQRAVDSEQSRADWYTTFGKPRLGLAQCHLKQRLDRQGRHLGDNTPTLNDSRPVVRQPTVDVMSKVFERLDSRWRRFIESQPMYFVATAPSGGDGHVNVSPKGYADTFAILGDTTVAYLDLDGSGVETIAHLRQNGRITIMFCSFTRNAKILRLFGRGRVVTPAEPDFSTLLAHFGPHSGVRTIIVVELDRIADSCGYAVPEMTEAADRDLLDRWAQRPDVRTRRAARAAAHRVSIDDLPALAPAETDPPREHWDLTPTAPTPRSHPAADGCKGADTTGGRSARRPNGGLSGITTALWSSS